MRSNLNVVVTRMVRVRYYRMCHRHVTCIRNMRRCKQEHRLRKGVEFVANKTAQKKDSCSVCPCGGPTARVQKRDRAVTEFTGKDYAPPDNLAWVFIKCRAYRKGKYS